MRGRFFKWFSAFITLVFKILIYYMCFNYKVSLFTFSIGILFSILLILYGNEKYKIENEVTGIFFIFISLIQFMDFLFWIDIKNKMGINKITTIVGPLLNAAQPLILFLIKYFYYLPPLDIFWSNPVVMLNVIYLVYFVAGYARFLSNGKLTTTSNSSEHLSWPWIKYFNSYFYVILLAINIFYLFDFNYALFVFIITYICLIFSARYFSYNVGELWCFFASFIPFFIFLYFKMLI